MKRHVWLLLGSVVCFGEPPPFVPLDRRAAVFTNVAVLPMDQPGVLRDQSLVVRGGRIVVVGAAAEVKTPKDAVVIDGRGRYLMPGLADLHIHLPYREHDREDGPALLKLFVAHGVTTVLNQFGVPAHLDLRRRVARGDVIGPVIYSTGFFTNEPYVTSPEDVERQIVKDKQAGFDFVKLHGELSKEAFDRLFAVARREGLRVIGHANRTVGLVAGLEKRQDAIVHVEEYLYGYFRFGRSCCNADELQTMVRDISKATAAAGTTVMPTLTVFKGIVPQIENLEAVLASPEMRFIPRGSKVEWQPDRNRYRTVGRDRVLQFKGMYQLQEIALKGLHEAGVPIVLGTDALGTAAALPGFSVIDELKNMAAAGMSNEAALKSATVNAAVFLKTPVEFGAVAVGRRADLLLLEANPLEDLANVGKRAGVMLRGRWFPESELRQMIAPN